MDDKELIELYFARSQRAVAETMNKYGGLCRAAAYRILGSREDSEECASDACLHAWQSIPPHRPENLPAFLLKLTRNAALHRYERQTAQKRGGGQVPLVLDELRECAAAGGERTAEDLAIQEVLNRFLGSLSQENRTIFLRRYWHFCTIAEIAAAGGISESKVKMSLLRSRKALRQLLEKEDIAL